MRDIAELTDSWQAYKQQHDAQRQATRDARRDLVDKIDAIRDKKPDHIGGHLKRAFDSVTKVPWMKYKIQNLNIEAQRGLKERERKAQAVYTELGVIVMGAPATDALVAVEYSALQDLRKHMKSTLNTISDAVSACKSATNVELMDTFSRNKFLSIASNIETRGAIRKINEAGTAIKDLQGRVEGVKAIDKNMPGDLAWHNNFDLVIDMFSEFAGTFTSITNINKLDDAKNDLAKASKDIRALDAQTEKQAFSLVSAAVQDPQVSPAVRGLVADVGRHLAKDIRPDTPKADTPAVAVAPVVRKAVLMQPR